MSGYFATLQYEAKQIESSVLKRRGFSDKEAFQQQQDLYEKRLESQSRREAARIQASAMREQADAMRDAFRRRR